MSTRYDMGFTVDGVAIPDPAEWEYEIADLDLSGERDATGTLHRDRVATKVNYSLSWNVLTWSQLQTILSALSPAQLFLVGPNPKTFNSKYSGYYYVGNRTGKTHFYLSENSDIAVYSLKCKLIEY